MTDADPDLPPADAMIMADPAETPVTKPDELTVATVDSDVDHVGAVFTTPPCPSSTVADSCVVAPTSTVAVLGETDTVVMASSGSGPEPGPTTLSSWAQAAMPTASDNAEILRINCTVHPWLLGGWSRVTLPMRAVGTIRGIEHALGAGYRFELPIRILDDPLTLSDPTLPRRSDAWQDSRSRQQHGPRAM